MSRKTQIEKATDACHRAEKNMDKLIRAHMCCEQPIMLKNAIHLYVQACVEHDRLTRRNAFIRFVSGT